MERSPDLLPAGQAVQVHVVAWTEHGPQASAFTRSADGMAELVGHAWTGAAADEYWLALAPSPVSPPPGLHGRFAGGTATLFPAGQAPCAGPT